MSAEAEKLFYLIKRYRLDWRHPRELRHVMRKLERGTLGQWQARIWLRRIQPWVKEQELCFNPFPPAPNQEELGHFDVEFGELIENPGVRVGIRLLDGARHAIVAGYTGSGKSNLLRRLVDGLDAINRSNGRIYHNPDS